MTLTGNIAYLIKEMKVSTNLNNMNLVEDEAKVDLASLTDFADEPSSGAWPDGWYKARTIEGYATRKGTQIVTADAISQKGDSRNMRLCFQVTNQAGETRNMFESFNYRLEDFSAERMALVKEARAEFKRVRGKGPGDAADLQRSSLALAKLGQLQRALGFNLTVEGEGISTGPLVNREMDLRIGTDDQGYNVVREFAKLGERSGGKKGR